MDEPYRVGVSAVVLATLIVFSFSPRAQTTSEESSPSPSDEQGGSWYGMLYYGRMTEDTLVDNTQGQFEFATAKLYSVEIGYTLEDENRLVRFLDPVLSSINLGTNLVYQDDPVGDIYQINGFIMLRWSNFPWNHKLRTTLGIAEGLSWSSEVPSIEIESTDPGQEYNKLVNYLAVEATMSLPSHKDWQLVYRLHHRSTIGGLLGDNGGSTAAGIGIRYYFK